MDSFIDSRLSTLRSDLADSKNPKILRKYPHLGSPNYIGQLEREIERLENIKSSCETLNIGE